MSISMKSFHVFAGIVFLLAGLLHLIRVAMGWELILNNYFIPPWLSILAVIITLFLAYSAFSLKNLNSQRSF